MSLASISIKAEWRLSVNDQHHPLASSSSLLSGLFPMWFFSFHGCKGRYLTYLTNWASSSFFGRPLLLDATRDPQYNMKQYNKINFIHISNVLLQGLEKKLKKHVLHRIWSQSWRTSRAVGGGTMLTASEVRKNQPRTVHVETTCAYHL